MDVLTLNRAEVESLLDLGELLDGLRDGFTRADHRRGHRARAATS